MPFDLLHLYTFEILHLFQRDYRVQNNRISKQQIVIPCHRPDGSYAYRVRASLVQTHDNAQIGHRGTAKLHGEHVLLGYWIIRRPMAALRAWMGM